MTAPARPFTTKILSADALGIKTCVAALCAGQLVALPTETVYGLAADARSEQAVAKIYAAKGRPSHNPLIVHVGLDCHSLASLIAKGLVSPQTIDATMAAQLEILIQKFWPGPLTIVLPRGPVIPALVAGGLDTVGLRMPAHQAFLTVLADFGGPLAAPSANRSNRISPTTAQHVIDELDGLIPLVLDGGASSVGVESTIVTFGPEGTLKVLRYGGVTAAALAAALGTTLIEDGTTPKSPVLRAPGMMRVHYAPEKPLILWRPQYVSGQDLVQSIDERFKQLSSRHIALVNLAAIATEELSLACAQSQWQLDCTQDLELKDQAIAHELYALLRRFDDSPAALLVVAMPESSTEGLWPAINDRLSRASAKWT